jgi:hypothetical protein
MSRYRANNRVVTADTIPNARCINSRPNHLAPVCQGVRSAGLAGRLIRLDVLPAAHAAEV